jgi:hypothetical protein
MLKTPFMTLRYCFGSPGFASGRAFSRSLAQGIGQNGAKYIEVNMLMKFLQGVPLTTQCLKSIAFIKKRSLECFHAVNTQH